MSCSNDDYAWRHAVGVGNWTSAPSERLLVMWSTSATHGAKAYVTRWFELNACLYPFNKWLVNF